MTRVFDPRVTRPDRVATATGAVVGGLTAMAVLVKGRTQTAVLAAVAAGVAATVPTRAMLRTQRDEIQETRDLWGLTGVMLDGRPWPAPGGWALGADALSFLIREMRRRSLRTVVELGPGTSSIVLGRAGLELEMYGLEHDPEYVQVLEANLRAHGLEDYKLIHAPLAATEVAGVDVQWYDEAALNAVPESIDVLIVDGPPNWDGRNNRAPAWPTFVPRMSSGGLVLVDDTQRANERDMALSWADDPRLRLLHDAEKFMVLEVA